MTDNELIDVMCTKLEAASAAAGWNYLVVQLQEPTLQGTATAPTIYFQKMFDHPYGWSMPTLTYDAAVDLYHDKERQIYETTFRISALVIQDPNNLNLPTASDVVNYLKLYICHRTIQRQLKRLGVSMLRVIRVDNHYFDDDRGVFEAMPAFDLVLIHERSITLETPAADTFEGTVQGV